MYLIMKMSRISLRLSYLSNPEDGVSINVKVWWVGDTEQDLHTGETYS